MIIHTVRHRGLEIEIEQSIHGYSLWTGTIDCGGFHSLCDCLNAIDPTSLAIIRLTQGQTQEESPIITYNTRFGAHIQTVCQECGTRLDPKTIGDYCYSCAYWLSYDLTEGDEDWREDYAA